MGGRPRLPSSKSPRLLYRPLFPFPRMQPHKRVLLHGLLHFPAIVIPAGARDLLFASLVRASFASKLPNGHSPIASGLRVCGAPLGRGLPRPLLHWLLSPSAKWGRYAKFKTYLSLTYIRSTALPIPHSPPLHPHAHQKLPPPPPSPPPTPPPH